MKHCRAGESIVSQAKPEDNDCLEGMRWELSHLQGLWSANPSHHWLGIMADSWRLAPESSLLQPVCMQWIGRYSPPGNNSWQENNSHMVPSSWHGNRGASPVERLLLKDRVPQTDQRENKDGVVQWFFSVMVPWHIGVLWVVAQGLQPSILQRWC